MAGADVSWNEGMDLCLGIGGKPVEPMTIEEHQAIYDAFDMSACKDPRAPKNECYQYWLGVTKWNGSDL